MTGWQELYEKVEPFVVRIETQMGSGTGFLFAYNENRVMAAFATAAHVVTHAHSWKLPLKLIHQTTGAVAFLNEDDRLIFTDFKRDSASILIQIDKLGFTPPAETLPLLDPSKYIRIGVDVAWMGYPSVANSLCLFRGCISSFVHSTDNDYYLIDGVAIAGVSGGPVFCEGVDNPKIIGTVSAYLPSRVYDTTLPGLLRAQDISAFAETVETIRSVDEARRMEREAKQTQEHERIIETRPADEPPDAQPPPTEPPGV